MYLVKYDEKFFLMEEPKELVVNDIIYIDGVITNATLYHVYNKSKLQFLKVIASEVDNLNIPLLDKNEIETYLMDNKKIYFSYKELMDILNYNFKLIETSTQDINNTNRLEYANFIKNIIVSNLIINVDGLFQYQNGKYILNYEQSK